MKIKYIQLLIVSMFLAVFVDAQQQLYFETFNGATNTFSLNDSIGPRASHGNNKWIVDSNYFGGGIYPKTMNEDSTFGGSITGAPYSKYLHIYDSASGYKNCNYNPSDSSKNFAHMTSGICTKGITDVTLNFYYLCQGSHTAYGRVFYSLDGGSWKEDSTRLHYDSTYKWRYQTIANPKFDNVEDLRIGFLWANNDTTGKDTSAMGIDDVIIFGSQDTASPITCTWSDLGYDSCLGDGAYVFLQYQLSDTLCDAIWDIYMSNSTGGFPGPYAWYQSIGPSYGNDIYGYWYLTIPNSYNIPGHCYKFKMERTTYPFYTFEDSFCIPFDSCPGTIQALQPVVTMDTNPVCVGSVIIVPFNSTGIYASTNVYYAQLIDSIGHTATIDTLGHLISTLSYPTLPPGSISGTIPLTAPAGCNYYVRVVSSTPNRKPYMYGPFCIQHCDINTDSNTAVNNIQACVGECYSQPKGFYDTITFNVHRFDSLAHYHPGNKFEVQVLSGMTFAAVNTGSFGTTVDTTKGKIVVHIPCSDSLTNIYHIAPGVYYMRIIATNSTFSDSSFGQVIFLTIGELPDSLFLTVTPASTTFCLGTTITFNTNPDDYYTLGSIYTWWLGENHTTVPFGGWNQGYLGYTPATPATFMITVQEDNYGCNGPKVSLPDSLTIMGKPNVGITGPTNVCLGDTVTYSVPFTNNSFYNWTVYGKSTVIPGGNTVKIAFDTVATIKVWVFGSDSCFSDSSEKTVRVWAKPITSLSVNPSTKICAGVADTLIASATTTVAYSWSTGKRTSSITVYPTGDTTFVVAISNSGCKVYDTAKITVLPLPNIKVKSDTTVCFGDTVTLRASGARTYNWLPNTGLTNYTDSVVQAIVTTSQTYTITGVGADKCIDTATVSVSPKFASGTVNIDSTSIVSGNSVNLVVTGGSTWLWSPKTGLSCDTCQDPIASPSVTTTYMVLIKDSNGCSLEDTLRIIVTEPPPPTIVCSLFVPNAFTPNNPHKDNTILYVRDECLATVDFVIFDRWGNKVFESNSMDKGWDGTYKGEAMNVGTYVYYVTGTTFSGQTLTQKGNVALIR